MTRYNVDRVDDHRQGAPSLDQNSCGGLGSSNSMCTRNCSQADCCCGDASFARAACDPSSKHSEKILQWHLGKTAVGLFLHGDFLSIENETPPGVACQGSDEVS